MKKKPLSLKSSKALRFRRWSRKASAVFHSLHSAVGIGCLSVAVLRSLEKKTCRIGKLCEYIEQVRALELELLLSLDLALSWGELCELLGISLASRPESLEAQNKHLSPNIQASKMLVALSADLYLAFIYTERHTLKRLK